MVAVVFDNLLAAQELCNQLSEQIIYSDEVTQRYAEPFKHPSEDKWAVFIRSYARRFVDPELIEALTDDWFEPVNNENA